MRTAPVRRLLAIGFILAATTARSSPLDDQAQADFRRMTQALLDAIAPGDTTVWQRYLDPQFVHMDENGVVRNQAEFLKELTPLPAGLVGRIEIDTWRLTVDGNTVVTAYEMQEYLDYHGQPLRTRFRSMDTWVSTPNGWRLVAEHTAAVLKDPPAIALTRDQLHEYEGVYSLTPGIETTIRSGDDGLTAERSGRPAVKYLGEIRDMFFAPGQPRSRRIFTRDGKGAVDGFVDRREGEDVRWKRIAR
jgi:hypothetical protein